MADLSNDALTAGGAVTVTGREYTKTATVTDGGRTVADFTGAAALSLVLGGDFLRLSGPQMDDLMTRISDDVVLMLAGVE